MYKFKRKRELSLCHHQTSASTIIFAHLEFESGLGHIIRITVMFLEHEFILFARFDVAEETEIDNETGVDRLGDCTVGEGVTMDLFDRSFAS